MGLPNLRRLLPALGALLLFSAAGGALGCSGATNAQPSGEVGPSDNPPSTSTAAPTASNEQGTSSAQVTNGDTTVADSNAGPPADRPKKPTVGSSAPGGGASGYGGPVGIDACDTYLTRMEACLAQADPANRQATQQALIQTANAWRTAAAQGGATRDAVRQGCEASLAALPPSCQ